MTVPGNLSSPLLATAADGAGAAANITKSLRFNSGDSTYLNRTPSSAGNQKTFTFSFWVKRCDIGIERVLLNAHNSSNLYTRIRYRNTNLLEFFAEIGSTLHYFQVPGLQRDHSAWAHYVIAVDTTLSTAADRLKIYRNGADANRTTITQELPQNADLSINSTLQHSIGADYGNDVFNGYLADIYLIDGSALDPTSFGAYDDNNVWQAATYSGTYGTNGFHLLDFANESTVGHDSSGNNNDFTTNNIETAIGTGHYAKNLTMAADGFESGFPATNAFNGSTSSWARAASTGQTMTWAPDPAVSYSSSVRVYPVTVNANVSVNGGSNQSASANGFTTVASGSGTITSIAFQTTSGSDKMRVAAIEVDGTILIDSSISDISLDVPVNGDQSDTGAGGEVSGNYATLNPLDNGGVDLSNGNLDVSNSASHEAVRSTIELPSSGKWYAEATHISNTSSSTNFSFGVDTSGAATPAAWNDSGKIYISTSSSGRRFKQDTSESTIDTTSREGDVLQVAYDADNQKLYLGINNTWYNSSLGTNGNPSSGSNPTRTSVANGFLSVNVYSATGSFNAGQRAFAYTAPTGFKALCTANLPTPTIGDGSDYFDAKLYTGNGGTTSVDYAFSPDFVWLKGRSETLGHRLVDTIRGGDKQLNSNTTSAEGSFSGVTFQSDGFDVANDGNEQNKSGTTYVAWAWDGGTSTVSNTDGTITSSVRANQTAGFSIATFTTPSSGTFSFGHGLSAAPELVLAKARNQSYSWLVYAKAAGNTKYLVLNTTAAKATGAVWNDTTPTSSVVSGNASNFGTSTDYVAYCFTSVESYSKIGEYIGNGSSDGTFVYLPFRPALILYKRHSGSGNWVIHDSAREPINDTRDRLQPNTSGPEDSDSAYQIDLLSNGFKFRGTDTTMNGQNHQYIFYAVAENPFQANGGLAR